MAFPQLGNSDHIVSVSTNFPINSKQDAPFQCLDYDYSQADWDGLCDHSEMFHGRISLDSVLLLLLVNFVCGFRYIFPIKVSGPTSLISMVSSSLCCSHSSEKSLFLFALTE